MTTPLESRFRKFPVANSTPDLAPTAAKVLEVATDLVTRFGLSKLTCRAVANEAGENSALISYYFGSKSGLVAAVVSAIIRQGMADLSASVSDAVPGRSRRRALFEVYRRWVRDPAEYAGYYAILSEVLHNEGLREHLTSNFRWQRELNTYALAPASPEPRPPSRELKALADLTVAIGDGLGLMVQADQTFDPAPCCDLWEALVDEFVARLGAQEGTAVACEADPPTVTEPQPGPAQRTDVQRSTISPLADHRHLWWVRPGLEVRGSRLVIAGHDAEQIARRHGTPIYVYDVSCVMEQLTKLRSALDQTACPYKLGLALKAQRAPQVLAPLRAVAPAGAKDAVEITACSPAEVEHALANGWLAHEISYVGTNVSDQDLEVLLAHKVRICVDSLALLDRLGQRQPGTPVGISVASQPDAPHAALSVSEARSNKPDAGLSTPQRSLGFGLELEQLNQALEIAVRRQLIVDTVHVELLHQPRATDGPTVSRAVAHVARAVHQLTAAGCPVSRLSIDGGPGTLDATNSEPLGADEWAACLGEGLKPLGVTLHVQPSEYLAKDSAILLVEVAAVSERRGFTLVGLAAGLNVLPLRPQWERRIDIVKCSAADALRTATATITGHIPDATDVFATDWPLPPLSERDILAIVGTGSDFQSASSTYCMRSLAEAIFFFDRV